jgi:hypothetical protein
LENYLSQRGVRDWRIWDALGRQAWPLRHPWLSGLILLPAVVAKGMRRAIRAALRFVLPSSAYGRLLRWRGGTKNRRWRARMDRIARGAHRKVADD